MQAVATAAKLSPADHYGNGAAQAADGVPAARSESSVSDVLAKHGIERV